jgi:hypothetical protein
MHKIELILRNSNLTLSVQRKLEEDANALYEQILAAIAADRIQTLKLSCDRYPKTKIAILNNEIVAINLTES